MMTTYQLDIAAALQHMTVTKGMSVAYKQQTPEACNSRASAQKRARAKRHCNEIDYAPDTRQEV